MRKRIVAGNWKMNLLPSDATKLYNEIIERSSTLKDADVLIFPPCLYLSELMRLNAKIPVGAQNFHPEEKGAFTGEVSVSQIASLGVKYALIGHSERRMYFCEKEDFLKSKVNASLSHGITPVFCCGEPLEVREKDEQSSFVRQQLNDSLFHLSIDEIKKCIIAYEPVWAIGTGKTATSEQAEEMHAAIRSWLKEEYNSETADSISILYGGSCNASNAKELFACPNVDGGLIGGASLDAETFSTIAQSF